MIDFGMLRLGCRSRLTVTLILKFALLQVADCVS